MARAGSSSLPEATAQVGGCARRVSCVTEGMVLAQRAKIGRYNFLIYRGAEPGCEREYRLYAKQGSEMRMLLRWTCGFASEKAALIDEVADFVCASCPGSRPAKVRAAIGDEIRYTCYMFPPRSSLSVRNSQAAVRELQKLVPTDMGKSSAEELMAHLYDRTPAAVVEVHYDADPSAPYYVLEWRDGFRERFDFDFVDSMFAPLKVARMAASRAAKILERGASAAPPSATAEKGRSKNGRC